MGGRICGSPVPKGLPQLPRPAIIRLSGATISVNVPDSGLPESKQGQLAGGIGAARAHHPIPSPLMLPATAKYCPLHHDSRTKCVFSYIAPLIPCYLDYRRVCAPQFSSSFERTLCGNTSPVEHFDAIASGKKEGSASFCCKYLT